MSPAPQIAFFSVNRLSAGPFNDYEKHSTTIFLYGRLGAMNSHHRESASWRNWS